MTTQHPAGEVDDIDKIRAALYAIHDYATGKSTRAYMEIPANPERDADLILSRAIDELAELRARCARLEAHVGALQQALVAAGTGKRGQEMIDALAEHDARVAAEARAKAVEECATLVEDRTPDTAADIDARFFSRLADAVRALANRGATTGDAKETVTMVAEHDARVAAEARAKALNVSAEVCRTVAAELGLTAKTVRDVTDAVALATTPPERKP